MKHSEDLMLEIVQFSLLEFKIHHNNVFHLCSDMFNMPTTFDKVHNLVQEL